MSQEAVQRELRGVPTVFARQQLLSTNSRLHVIGRTRCFPLCDLQQRTILTYAYCHRFQALTTRLALELQIHSQPDDEHLSEPRSPG
jgi:hypothetical protein